MSLATLAAPPRALAEGSGAAVPFPFLKMVFATRLWTGRRQIRGLAATLDGAEVDDDRVSRPQAKLYPADLADRVEGARAAVYKAFNLYTLPDGKRGVRLVPVRSLAESARAIDAAIATFNTVADEVAAALPRIREHNRAYWYALARVDAAGNPTQDDSRVDPALTEARYLDLVDVHLPRTSEEMRAHFAVEYRLAEASDAAERYTDPIIRDFVDRAAAEYRRHQRELIALAIEEPARRVAAAIDNLRARLEGPADARRRLTPDSFAELSAALTLLESCGDAAPARLLNEARHLRDSLARIESTARDRHAGGETYTAAFRDAAPTLVAAMDAVAQTARDRAARREVQERYGIAPRRIAL